jgi:hypothetical protein
MIELLVVCFCLYSGRVCGCDDEETSCSFMHPTIPASPEGLARYWWCVVVCVQGGWLGTRV